MLVTRRDDVVALLRNLPDTLPIEVAGFTSPVDVAALTDAAIVALRGLALDLAANAVFIVLQLATFTIVLYGLLLRPDAVGDAVFEITPPDYHDVIRRLN